MLVIVVIFFLQLVSARIWSLLTLSLLSVCLPAEGKHRRPVDSQRPAQPGGRVYLHGSDGGWQRRCFSQAGGPRWDVLSITADVEL